MGIWETPAMRPWWRVTSVILMHIAFAMLPAGVFWMGRMTQAFYVLGGILALLLLFMALDFWTGTGWQIWGRKRRCTYLSRHYPTVPGSFGTACDLADEYTMPDGSTITVSRRF